MALAVSACATGSTAAPDLPAAIAASREFQRGYDQQLRDDPASFLTTVAAYYLAPGDAIAAPVTSEIELTLGAVEHGQRHTLSISRQELDWRVLVHDQQAPLRAEFPGVAWFPVDARFIVTARYRPSSPREPMLLQTSRGVSKTLYVAGEAEFAIAGVTATLLVFGYAPEPGPGETMLIPFRDASSGRSSYAAGRYLEIDAPTGAELLLDFNRATNPLCAYSEHYNCPMPPQFNLLPVAIEAGARSPH